jgi:FAD/FMN-containing dehydrogenase/Fe-S oxidoreductase
MIRTDTLQATEEFIHELRGAVSEAHFDKMTRLLYSTDASIYQMMPVGVVTPRHADEVAAAVEIAAKHHVPVLPRGSGSSLDGQATGHALVIDMTRHMNKVIAVDPEQRTVRAQPGITLGATNRIIAKYGLQFGPDPASADRATVGGIVGNNSTGAHSIIYGMTSDHVNALDVVLADGSRAHLDAFNGDTWADRAKRPGLEGQIYRSVPGLLERYTAEIATRYPKTWRTVAGYNLNHVVEEKNTNIARLVVGSEGTLASTVEATLNLVPLPKMRRLVLVQFPTVREGLESVPRMLETQPTAIEMMDKMLFDQCRSNMEYSRYLNFIEGDPAMALVVEYSGDTEAELEAGVIRLREVLKRLNHRDVVLDVIDAKAQANVWYVRKVGLGLLMGIKGDAKPLPFIEDGAVPVEHLADYVDGIVRIVQDAGLSQVAIYAHASAGCLHLRPLINLKSVEGMHQLRQIAEGAVDLILKYGGSPSGEHGEGLARGEFSERVFGAEMVRAFHEVKAAFDPDCIMNPGKIVDAPRMDDPTILRFGPDYQTPLEPNVTTLNFSVDGGFARAVELCNGAGVCRKIETGVMCPSFMATRDEAHSTRGRANALRSAMMGFLGPDGVTTEEVHDVLDLCLSCKACKSECPSSVDMAKLKAEWQHLYHQEHGTPIRSRVFANIAKLNQLGRIATPITNAMLRGPAKWAMTQMGVHPKRTLPMLAPKTFSAWWKSRPRAQAAAERQSVVFFHDTFMEHNHPQIGQAAVTVLEAAGYHVIVVEKHACCGRPAISKGLLDEGKHMATANVELLAPYALRGIAIVGCEPSCIGTLVDEYPDLVPGDEAKAVAKASMLLDDFIAREAVAGRLVLNFDDTPRRVLLHGHCHQKALFGTAGTVAMLKLIPNLTVDLVESSCCGMAGSFGYETEHYELSMQLAEMNLAPAVRAADAGTIIAAPGTSCREQIEHTTGRAPLHPIEILASALKV